MRLAPLLGLLLLPLLAGAADPADTVRAWFDGVDTLRARFTQRVYDSGGILLRETRGELAIARPDRFRLEYTAPYRQLYVADGERLWAYDEDLEQVTVHPQADRLRESPALILADPARLTRAYTVRALPGEGGLRRFELTPRGGSGDVEKIILAFDEHLLRAMEIHDSFGQRTLLRFERLQINPLLDDRQFTFTPPPGVDVIGADGAPPA